MLEQLDQIERDALTSLEGVQDEEALQGWRVAHLGRSAPLMQAERPAIGRRANQVKKALEEALAARSEELHQAAVHHALEKERLDVTLPGRPLPHGRRHPSTLMMRDLAFIFNEMGFQIYRSREVETDELNFQLLNFPPNHPAREMQDTYYVDTGYDRGDNPVVLRTHTSPGQIHAMR